MACDGRHPRVGIFALITNEKGEVLVGQRLSTLGKGQWGFPGGHLEQGEDFFACVERETLEETGLDIRGLKILGTTNDWFPTLDKHYVTVIVNCELKDPKSEPKLLEPEKCTGWHWKSWEEIEAMSNHAEGTEKLFLPMENLIRENPGLRAMLEA